MQAFTKQFQRFKRAQVRRFRQWRKHPFGLPIAVFFGLVLVGGILVLILSTQDRLSVANDAHIVIVTHDGEEQAVPTHAKTVGSLIQKLHLTVGRNDRVEPTLDTQILQDNFRVNIYRAAPVTIYDGASSTTTYSAATTARSAATGAGLTVYPEDTVTAAPATNILTSRSIVQTITIDRSTPINLNLYGTQTAVRSHAKTVGDLLSEKHIKLVGGATVTPVASTPVAANMQVFILSRGVRIESVQETIAVPVEKVDDNNLTLGTTVVRQAGSAGQQLVTYQITADDTGKEISRKIIQTVVTVTPVTQIVAVGKNVAVPADKTAIMQAVGISPSDYGYVDYIVSHEGGWAGTTKYNKSGSGAYGICQALPGSKMASAGADWATNPVTQLRWCNSYAVGKFGGWAGAYNYWLSHHYW